MLTYRVIIEKDEDGVLVAKVPDLPGCATEGKTREELMKNVKEAIQADKTPIALMNGEQLVMLLMEYGIGVHRSTPDLFEIDEN